MGKTGTTSDFRDALFVGSTYGTQGITVAVRIGFDDNRPLGDGETGGRTALPVFREIMLRVYKDQLVGRAPRFPREIEDGIDQYLRRAGRAGDRPRNAPGTGGWHAAPGTIVPQPCDQGVSTPRPQDTETNHDEDTLPTVALVLASDRRCRLRQSGRSREGAGRHGSKSRDRTAAWYAARSPRATTRP